MSHGSGRLRAPWILLALLAAAPAGGQQGAVAGEWRHYAGDPGSTRYSPLDQIGLDNAAELKITWRWKAENFGPRPDFYWQVTPLMVDGVLYMTAGLRRSAVAVDAATGETLWTFRFEEGERGSKAVRNVNRGLAYWDGDGAPRILLISPGYHLIALDARSGRPVESFGKAGIVDLWEGLDRDVKPGEIGASSPPVVVGNVAIVGGAMLAGGEPPSSTAVPGYVRGYDVRTGKLLWTFRTIPRPGEVGNETWGAGSWEYTGNTAVWAPMSVDPELGYVYLPVETPTGDYYGGHRPGDNLFGESLVALDARTGKRVWHFQTVHHGIWDYDLPTQPILADLVVGGRPVKAVVQLTKQGFAFVFDRVTGEPVWPIEERPVPPSDVPGERTSPTQPFPTLPAAYDRQGMSKDDLIDFTPEIRAEAERILAQYRHGPLYTPPSIIQENGTKGTLQLPSLMGGVNWQGGAFDPETGLLYVPSVTNPVIIGLEKPGLEESDMDLVRGRPPLDTDRTPNIGPWGLPLVKPPWGRITAIDLNTGEHRWMVVNGETPEYIRNHPKLAGVDLGETGQPERAHLLVTKTMLVGGDGPGVFAAPPGAGGKMLRIHDKRTGAVVHEMELPGRMTGHPMTYMLGGKQYLVVAVGGPGIPAELVALTLP